MHKVVPAITAILFAATSSIALASSDNGQGDGKGRTGPAASVSNGTGGSPANAASGFNGGWGQNGGVANGNARSFDPK